MVEESTVERVICLAERKFIENIPHLKKMIKNHRDLKSLFSDQYRLSLRLSDAIAWEVFNIERFFAYFIHIFFFLFENRKLIKDFRKLKQIVIRKDNKFVQEIMKEKLLRKFQDKLNDQPILLSLLIDSKVSKQLVSEPVPCPSCLCREFDVDDEQAVCTKCGCKQIILSVTSTFNDINRINLSQKYTYSKDQHFKECILQFQGKKAKKIPSAVFQYVKDHDPKTLMDVVSLLKLKPEFKKFSDESMYIFREISCRPVEDIGHLEGKLHSDFAEFTNAYDKYFGSRQNLEDGISTRTNFINVQYVLCRLLTKNGFFGSDADLTMFQDKINSHSLIVDKIFSILDW